MHPIIWILIALIIVLVWPKRKAYYHYMAGFFAFWTVVAIGRIVRWFRG